MQLLILLLPMFQALLVVLIAVTIDAPNNRFFVTNYAKILLLFII